jgi:hypothetical protein
LGALTLKEENALKIFFIQTLCRERTLTVRQKLFRIAFVAQALKNEPPEFRRF